MKRIRTAVSAAVLIESRNHKSRGDLTTNLGFERMPELQRDAFCCVSFLLGERQAVDIGVGNGMFDLDTTSRSEALVINEKHHRICKTGEQRASVSENSKRLFPDWNDVRHKNVRYGVHNGVEGGVGENAEIRHVALDSLYAQLVACCDGAVLLQLVFRVVEYGNVRTRCG